MSVDELKARTKNFGLRVLNLVDSLPNSTKGWAVGNQLVRSGISVGANYRAACRARSRAEFISRIGTLIEEADESAYWLELIMEGKLMPRKLVESLWKEANELVAIMTQSRKTAEKGKGKYDGSKEG